MRSETNCEDFIRHICPYACFTDIANRRCFVIFPIDCTATLLGWLKTENKWYFTWKHKNVYSLWQLLSFIIERVRVLRKVWVEAGEPVDHHNCRINQPTGLSFLRKIASNDTSYDILLIICFKSTYYVEILTRLHGVVYRQRPELWLTVTWSCV